MGLSKKKSKTVSDSHTVSTAINPAQVTSGLTGMADKITGLQNMNPQDFTTGATQLQQQAEQGAVGLGGGIGGAFDSFNRGLDGAQAGMQGVMDAEAPLASGYMKAYQDPYLNDVVNTTLTGFDKDANMKRAQAQLDLAQDSTFGGNGGGIYKALLERDLGDGRAGIESGLRSQGFQTALAAAQGDAGRVQQQQALRAATAGQMAGLAGQRFTGALGVDENARANISTQGAMGDEMRQIELQRKLAPLTSASAIAGLWGATPFGLLHGQDQTNHSTSKTTVSDPMGTIAGIAGGIGSLATGLGGLGLKIPGLGGAAGGK